MKPVLAYCNVEKIMSLDDFCEHYSGYKVSNISQSNNDHLDKYDPKGWFIISSDHELQYAEVSFARIVNCLNKKVQITTREIPFKKNDKVVAFDLIKQNIELLADDIDFSDQIVDIHSPFSQQISSVFFEGIWEKSISEILNAELFKHVENNILSERSLSFRRIIPLYSDRLFTQGQEQSLSELFWKSLANAFADEDYSEDRFMSKPSQIFETSNLSPLCYIFAHNLSEKRSLKNLQIRTKKDPIFIWTSILAKTDALLLICDLDKIQISNKIRCLMPKNLHEKLFSPEFMHETQYLIKVAEYIVSAFPVMTIQSQQNALLELLDRAQSSENQEAKIDISIAILKALRRHSTSFPRSDAISKEILNSNAFVPFSHMRQQDLKVNSTKLKSSTPRLSLVLT